MIDDEPSQISRASFSHQLSLTLSIRLYPKLYPFVAIDSSIAPKRRSTFNRRTRAPTLIFHPRTWFNAPGTKRPLVECNNLNALGVHISIRRTSEASPCLRTVKKEERKERKKKRARWENDAEFSNQSRTGSKENGTWQRRRESARTDRRRTEKERERERAQIGVGAFEEKGSRDHNSHFLSFSLLILLRLDPWQWSLFLASGRDDTILNFFEIENRTRRRRRTRGRVIKEGMTNMEYRERN